MGRGTAWGRQNGPMDFHLILTVATELLQLQARARHAGVGSECHHIVLLSDWVAGRNGAVSYSTHPEIRALRENQSSSCQESAHVMSPSICACELIIVFISAQVKTGPSCPNLATSQYCKLVPIQWPASTVRCLNIAVYWRYCFVVLFPGAQKWYLNHLCLCQWSAK